MAVGHEGLPNKRDWEILVKAARMAQPTWIEPYSLSKAGHVHVDWRPTRQGGTK